MADTASAAASSRRGSYQADKAQLLIRLRRVAGQVNGIAAMVETERYCPEVLVQISASVAGLEKVGFLLLRDHVRHCVAEDLERGRGDESLDELIATIKRFAGR
ncbi:MAG: metal-sensitive transcriptional regulator [Candidatus Dormibacteria bacterium]